MRGLRTERGEEGEERGKKWEEVRKENAFSRQKALLRHLFCYLPEATNSLPWLCCRFRRLTKGKDYF